MGIKLSEKAAGEVKRIMQEQSYGPETLLRVGVNGGGCSGFSYALGFDKNFDEKTDSKCDQHGVTVVVDKKSACTWTARRSTFTTAWRSAASRSTIRTRSRLAAAAARSRPDLPPAWQIRRKLTNPCPGFPRTWVFLCSRAARCSAQVQSLSGPVPVKPNVRVTTCERLRSKRLGRHDTVFLNQKKGCLP